MADRRPAPVPRRRPRRAATLAVGTTPVWWLRTDTPDVVTLHGVASSERSDGAVVAVSSLAPGAVPRGPRLVRARMRADSRQVLSVEVLGEVADVAPPLVLHEVVRRDLEPVEVHLVAFLHDAAAGAGSGAAGVPGSAVVPPGTVLTANDLRALGLTARDQVAAVRWIPATGQVLEVYVDPGYRRRRIATSVLLAAEACAVARGWPALWGGGLRTELGEALLRGLRWGVRRARELERIAPPMTPPGEEAGRLRAP